MIDISVVSGTYNRLPFLQKMVNSARLSIAGVYGITLDFSLCDGGSTDGTIEWCKQQPDIKLIEHGELRGAVKSFNDAAFQASGSYCVLANDDVEIVGDSILKAWLYMQSNPDCGIGCFYQDRNNRDWHIEDMPVVRDGRQSYGPYGQVCIVPKWLGDFVGWWGTYLHTYGGDNELSSRVYEQGFKVSPVPGARIHDREANDDLRKKNNITGGNDPKAVRGHHPDSWAWGRRWRNERLNLVGPHIKDTPMLQNPIRAKERVLYLPIYEGGWPVQKEQKRGLREALSKVAFVVEYDYVSKYKEVGKQGMMAELMDIITRIDPTLILTQLHNPTELTASDIAILRGVAPSCPFINWNGDYWPDNLLSKDGLTLAKAFDLQTTVNRSVLEDYLKQGINAAYWQVGWEPDGINHEPTEYHDVVFLGSGYSQSRRQFIKRVRGLDGITFGLYGPSWPDGWSKGQNLYDFKEACKVYRGAKISLGDSQWPDSGFVSNRVFQALAAGGALLAHQYFRGMEELGLVDNETCVIWRTLPELEEKIRWYLSDEASRRTIALAGEQLALERHSFDSRVRELWIMLERQKKAVEDWRW